LSKFYHFLFEVYILQFRNMLNADTSLQSNYWWIIFSQTCTTTCWLYTISEVSTTKGLSINISGKAMNEPVTYLLHPAWLLVDLFSSSTKHCHNERQLSFFDIPYEIQHLSEYIMTSGGPQISLSGTWTPVITMVSTMFGVLQEWTSMQ